MTNVDTSSLTSQLQALLQQYQSSPSRAAAAQIVQLAQEWLAADPNAPASLQQTIQNLAGADPFALQSMVTTALPSLQQAVNASATQPGGSGGSTAPNPANPSNPYNLNFNFGGPVGSMPPGGYPATSATTYPMQSLVGTDFFGNALSGAGSAATPPNGVSGSGDQQVLNETVDGVTYSLSFNTAQDIINSALQTVGIDPTSIAASGINAGQTLGNFFWSQIVNQGITDPTTIGDMIGTLLPSTGQFQTAFPGYHQALANGYVRTVAEYVSAEEGITAVMLQGGVPKDMINPTTVGNLISNGVSVNEVASRVQNGLDAALNAPAEVQNYFAQEFGAGQGPAALATVFLNPDIDAVTLQKMLAGAQIRGAAAASNLTISQGLSQRLADQGQTYASAQSQFKNLTAQAGLFQQTVGEHNSQAPVPGTQNANMPLSESQQGVEAAFGMNSNAVQQVHQAALARQNAFRGGGGASTSQQEGYSGLSESKPF